MASSFSVKQFRVPYLLSVESELNNIVSTMEKQGYTFVTVSVAEVDKKFNVVVVFKKETK
jgi:hypothetical protein